MEGEHFVRRGILLVAGLIISALGVSLSIKAALGTSPISSVPYVTSQISGLSVGTTTIIMNTCFVVLELLILRRDSNWTHVAQIAVAFIMGSMIDVWDAILPFSTPSSYLLQWAMCACGVVFVALGISMEVRANMFLNAGEGLVMAMCRVLPWKFGNMKVAFDVCCVLFAVVSGLLCLHGLIGVREGTVAAAICVGLCVKVFNRIIHKIDLRRWELAD
ncbi:YitT family protein [Bifidobacterium sp. BRDM6]|uniref:YitT family protein n=1 Tax=Bifidobacterium choloepi TaxID=2614131 RepID=A0A6I5NI03_9BIFI|nr:DUF6198 family protein [Bifidobacterium choloepi]NEG69963.1 YitT family protein [Bifidobacterium choloepi]